MMEAATAEIRQARAIGSREKLAAFFELTKPRIAFMLVLSSAA
jgi:heme O synthase-like polyprenyltransferase